VEDLTAYIPDFGVELYDLHQFTDGQIKGNILSRVALLLLKHIRDPDLQQKLPDILALLKNLGEKEDLSWEQIKEVVEQAISKETGEYVMSLLEKTKNEGRVEGKQEGLKEGIEMGLTLKFPGDIINLSHGFSDIQNQTPGISKNTQSIS